MGDRINYKDVIFLLCQTEQTILPPLTQAKNSSAGEQCLNATSHDSRVQEMQRSCKGKHTN